MYRRMAYALTAFLDLRRRNADRLRSSTRSRKLLACICASACLAFTVQGHASAATKTTTAVDIAVFCDAAIRTFRSNNQAAHQRLEDALQSAFPVTTPLKNETARYALLSHSGLAFGANTLPFLDFPLSQAGFDSFVELLAQAVDRANTEEPQKKLLAKFVATSAASGAYRLNDGFFVLVSYDFAFPGKVTCGFAGDDGADIMNALGIDAAESQKSDNGVRTAQIHNSFWQPAFQYNVNVLEADIASRMDVPPFYLFLTGDWP